LTWLDKDISFGQQTLEVRVRDETRKLHQVRQAKLFDKTPEFLLKGACPRQD
jgi:hypothetical protein